MQHFIRIINDNLFSKDLKTYLLKSRSDDTSITTWFATTIQTFIAVATYIILAFLLLEVKQ